MNAQLSVRVLRWRTLLLALLVCTSCVSCGWLVGDDGLFRDSAMDYREARELPVIEVPAGRNETALQEIYAIPPVRDEVPELGVFEVPRPLSITAMSSDQLVRIQRLGEQSWALIGVPPGQLWPQVRNFLVAAGVRLASADARQGLLDSDWLQLRGSEIPARFRFRIERGVQRGTSELHVLHMHRSANASDWPPVSDDLEQESEMLRAVAQYIANSSETAPVSMIAEQSISATGRIALEEDEQGGNRLRLGLPFTRAWASLALALEASTYEINDRDRSAGRYYVRFLGPDAEQKQGWFSRLFGRNDRHPLAGNTYLLTVESQGEEEVLIRIQSDGQTPELEEREEQALLSQLQGSIN